MSAITQSRAGGVPAGNGKTPAKASARTIVAVSIGNALEWFDLVVYGFLALTIAKLFFPADNETASLLLTLGTFGVSFFMRPLGSIVLGAYADRVGRQRALTLSVSLMMLGTLLIAIAPTYATIGLAAPTLLVVARLIQGFSAGGEFGSATAFLAEQDPQRRGFFSSWQLASQGLTTILASGFGVLLNTALTAEQLASWGWRLPFCFGLLIAPVAIYIRNRLEETDEFRQSGAQQTPLRETLSDQKLRMLVSLGLVILGTIAAYTTLFIPSFAVRQLGIAASYSFAATLGLGVIQLVFIPIFGTFSDRVGRLPIMTAAAAVILLGAIPCFVWLTRAPSPQTLFAALTLFALATAAYAGPAAALMAELFPTRTRGTGLSISYSFAVTIFGGFAPFIIAWLIARTGSNLAPAFYVTFGAAASLLALFGARALGAR